MRAAALLRQLLTSAAALAFCAAGVAPLVLAGLIAAGGLVLAARGRRRAVRLTALALLLGGAVLAAGTLVVRERIAAAIGAPRLAVLLAMRARPGDPWPRGAGHIPFGPAGAAERQKAYLEPGGGFSPAAGTFGVAFWVVGADGAVVTTSDTLPLDATSAAYVRAPDGVAVHSAFYDAVWTVAGARHFHLALVSHPPAGAHLEVAIRGVGPSGGALTSIRRDGAMLMLGDSWRVGPVAADALRFLGIEGPGWLRPAAPAGARVDDPAGWAAARFAVGGAAELEVAAAGVPPAAGLSGTAGASGAPPAAGSVGAVAPAADEPADRLVLDGIDPVFTQALRAQVMTLQESVVGAETRPGDPMNYPLQWLRDGAYVVVALARAGQTAQARALTAPLIDADFFGGFGAEADAPGLALWALAETAALTGAADAAPAAGVSGAQPAASGAGAAAAPGSGADQGTAEAPGLPPAAAPGLWAAVQRKAGIIGQMLQARTELREDFAGPVVPAYAGRPDLTLVAGPARDGLIDGRMDWGRPVFFVNAASYAGLQGAARLARILGHAAEAQAWSAEAAALGARWRAAFAAPGYDGQRANERTAIVGLWPSGIADPAAYGAWLAQLWPQLWDDAAGGFRTPPLWTYFDIAQAHQWLELDRPDRAWDVLGWFWRHQPAPGLYTLWEGAGEENSFGLWRQTRGWVRPPDVTPHYWAAAEVLLLQLAMLAEVRETPGGRVLVIGAGVPAAWLARPIRVAGIGTSAGFVDWSWDGERVEVHVADAALPVRLGAGFPPGTPFTRR